MIELLLALAALILGIIAVIEAGGRSWAGWGVICLSLIWLIANVGGFK